MIALIIEESISYKRLIENALEALGVDTRFVKTGKEALKAIEKDKFDFICVDLYLPDMNGFEVCRRIRGNAANSTLPVVMLTAQEKAEFLEESFDAGLTEIIYKSDIDAMAESLEVFVNGLKRILSGRVLLVESSPTTGQLLKYMLKKMKLHVDLCTNSEEAFQIFIERDYDIVITDMVLEGAVSGLRLLRKIRALNNDRKRTPVLGIFATEHTACKIEMLRSGANDYVNKPVVEEEFTARVSNLVLYKKLIDDIRINEEKLRLVSITDSLTKLYNRYYLNESVDKSIANAIRYKYPLSFVMIDVDNFKSINDNHGHEAGDEVLVAIGKLLNSSCRTGDVAARIGGDEFLLILDHCNHDNAINKAEQLRQNITKLLSENFTVSASIGVCSLSHDKKQSYQALFKEADSLMYKAKKSGRNQVAA